MEPERWRRIQELFHRAVDLPGTEREELLSAECGPDLDLRAEVERLLDGDRTGPDVFSRLEAHTRPPAQDPLLGRTLGAYRLKSRLASGGMGVVYRAERADGLFEQEVAVKLVRSEHATEWLLRRFEFERRTLAALEHPCIARLYDGGTTEDGCPYLVMELVRGQSIDRYCERERLALADRLRLFLQVCRAVHFAHQNLVVHCDLKPSNILIDERGLPRLLDFGIARLLVEGSAEAAPGSTRTIARVLTPEYASPEQLAGGPVTTALDVYALGVLLYELSTGRRPFESQSRSPADWERIVRDRTPERPSTRVLRAEEGRDPRSIAQGFRSTPAGLGRTLRGDLDRIVLMALRKEPERRYASVKELADDVERHLAGLPVRARPSSILYLASKFVRRHRWTVAAGSTALAALLVGYVSARRGEHRAEVEAQHASLEADSFHGIASFLMDGFLPDLPAQDAGWLQRARERILAQADRARRQYADSAHQRANMLDTLGQVCTRLDLHAEAEALVREAMDLRERAFGPRSLEYALSLRSLGQIEHQAGEFASAAQHLERALAIHRAAGSGTHADVPGVANDLAACLRNLGREPQAEALHKEALALRRAAGDGTLPVAESLNNLAGVHLARGDLEAAIAELREALAIRDSILGGGHLLTLQTGSNLAGALWRHGERDEARALMQRAEVGYRALGGDGEDGLGLVLANLAAMQLAVNDLDAAAASLEEALALQRKRLGPDHPLLAATLSKLAVLHHARHKDDEARTFWEETVRIRRASDGAPRDLAEALHGYGVFLLDVGEMEEAMRLARDALDIYGAQEPKEPAGMGRAEYLLGCCCARSGMKEAAREHWTEAARLLDSSPLATPDERSRVARSLEQLGKPGGG